MAERDLQSIIVTAQNQFSDPVRVNGGTLAIFVRAATEAGAFVANVSLQIAFTEGLPGPDDWLTDEVYTGKAHQLIEEPAKAWYRLGVKTGDFTSGPILLRLQKGRSAV